MQLERALDDPLAGRIDDAGGMTGLVAGRASKPRRSASSQKEELSGERWAPGACSSARCPRGVSCQNTWRPTLRRVTSPLSSSRRPVRLTWVSSVSSSRRSSALPSCGRAVEHAQELVRLRAPGHAGRRRRALEPPVGEGDRGVQPPEQLLALAGARPRIAERVERRAERLGVALEHGVDQPESNGVEAAGFRLEPRDPAEERPERGFPAGLRLRGHDHMVARLCQVCVK